MGITLNIKCLFANLSISRPGMPSLPIYALSTQQNGVLPSEWPILQDKYARRAKRLQLCQILSYVNSEMLFDPYRTLHSIFHALDFCLVCCGMFSFICSVLPPNSAFPPVILLPCTTLPFSFTSLTGF